jgi:ribosomal protein L18E
LANSNYIDALIASESANDRMEAAKSEILTIAQFESLAADSAESIRAYIAGREDLPPSVLERLSNDPARSVIEAVLTSTNFTLEIGLEMAASDNYYGLMLLSVYRGVPVEILKVLAQNPNSLARQFLSWNSRMNSQILEILSSDSDKNIRANVAGSETVSDSTLERLATDESKEVRIAVASNLKASPKLLDKMSMDTEKSVLKAVAENLRTSSETRQKFTKTNAVARALSLSNNGDLDSVLTFLEDSKVTVRVSAILRLVELEYLNAIEAKKMLEEFGTTSIQPIDRWFTLRMDSPESASTAFDLLLGLKADALIAKLVNKGLLTDAQMVRVVEAKLPVSSWAIAHAVELTPVWLSLLASAPSHSETAFREANKDDLGHGQVYIDGFLTCFPQIIVAEHQNTPSEIVSKLRKARSKYVRAAAISRQDSTEKDLTSASKDAEPLVRATVASHSNTPSEIISLLASDVDERVRNAVLHRRTTSFESKAIAAILGANQTFKHVTNG